MQILIFILILLAALGGPAWSLTIGGRLSTALYTYEGRLADTTATTHLRAYQNVRLSLEQLGLPELSFHTYVRSNTDLLEKAENDPHLHLYNAYLSWKRPRYRLQLGRQRVYAGVGHGTIDGVRGTADRAGFELTLYAGPLVPLGQSMEVHSWSEGHMWGGRISTAQFFNTTISLGFVDRQRQPVAYAAPGRYSGFQGKLAPVVQRLVGLDFNRRFAAGHRLYGRLDYDLKDEGVRRLAVNSHYVLSPRFTARAGWYRRKPAVFYNSLFSVFPHEDYQEISARLYYNARPGLRFSAHFATLLYDGDSSQRLGLTTSIGDNYSIGYYRSMGYARASDGLVGSIYYPLGRKLLLVGSLDLASYERYEDAADRDELVTAALGLTYRPTPKTFVELQVQGLRNPVFASDMRLFLRGGWRFFNKNGKK